MKALWIAAALAICTTPLLAQAPDGGAPPPAGAHQLTPQQRMAHLALLLDLNDTQKTQVQAVLDEEHAKMKAQFEQAQASGTRPSFQQMHSLHEQLEQETITKLTPVLTPAQMEKFKVLLEERDSHGPPPGGPRSGGPHAQSDAPPPN